MKFSEKYILSINKKFYKINKLLFYKLSIKISNFYHIFTKKVNFIIFCFI